MTVPLQVSLDHLHLRSPDPDAAARFYVESLGATPTDRIETPEMLRVIVALGGARLFIERVPADTRPGAEAPHLGLEHIGLTVPDLDEAAATLRAKGVVFTMEPKSPRPGLRIAFIRGPDGVPIELLERRD